MKKQRYKRNLGKLLRTYIKAKMPSTTESIVYLMEVFKFVNRQVETFSQMQEFQQPNLEALEIGIQNFKGQLADNALIIDDKSPTMRNRREVQPRLPVSDEDKIIEEELDEMVGDLEQ